MAKQKKNNGGEEKKIITDPRFSAVHSDPRFQKARKQQAKVTIDSRFNRMFTDKNFASSSAPVDKRGKSKKQKSVDPLRQYYNLDDNEQQQQQQNNKIVESEINDDDDDEGSEEDTHKKKNISYSKLKPKKKIVEDESEDEDDEDDEGSESESEEEQEIDYDDLKQLDEKLANGGGDSTDSDTDDDDDMFDSEEESEEESDEEVPLIEEETRRLAVVKMDWGQVRAVDLYVAMNSFVPAGGQILSVSVYPSEFGQKRMEEEAVKGPIGLFDSDKEMSDDDDENGEFDPKKLRAYEMSRLRYYFAVVECDSSATASYIYRSCDGMEFERSSNKLDLRFIPDTVQFEYLPRDVATEVPPKYERPDFTTDVLQNTNISLSWDKDEPHRVKALWRKKFTDAEREEMDLKVYLASESDDTEVDEAPAGQSGNRLETYRALLEEEDGSDGDDDKDMEVTFNTGLEDISKRILEKKKDKESETVWEAHLRRKKEKKRAMRNKSKGSSDDESSDDDDDREVREEPDDFFIKEPSAKSSKMGRNIRGEKQEEDTKKEQEASRAELELLLADDQGAERNLKGYNLKNKKSKGKKGKEIPAEDKIPSGEYDDPRFKALFTSPLYALDPTDAQYKRSAAYARQVAQRQHKGGREETVEKEQREAPAETLLPPDDTSSKKSASKMENPEISSLIRSMKRKAEQYQATCNGKASKKVVGPSMGLLPKLSAKFLSGRKKAKVSKD